LTIRTCAISSRHNSTSIKIGSFYSIGGRPQTPELQVGQLISEGPVPLDAGLKNEEKSLLGFVA
jgi:hypothetical protein